MRIGEHDLDSEVFIIAEIGANHEGDFRQAVLLIKKAAEAGANAVKFQTYLPRGLSPQVKRKGYNTSNAWL